MASQGTGLPLPQANPVLVQPGGVTQPINADRYSNAQSWAQIAQAGAKLADATGDYAKVEIHQAKVGYLAEQDTEIARTRTEMRDRFANDPAGFDAHWTAYKDGKIGAAEPWAVGHLTRQLGAEGNAGYSAVLTERRATDRRLDGERIGALAAQSGSDVVGSAMAGTLATPDGEIKIGKFRAVLDSAVTADLMPKEKADLLFDETMSQAQGEIAARDGVQVFHEKGFDAAVSHLRKAILENETLSLKGEHRYRAFNRGMEAVRLAAGQNKIDVHAHKKQVTETIEALKTSAPYDPVRLNDLMNQSANLGDVESFHKLATYRAFHNWRVAIAAMPVPEQVEALRAMRSGANLVDRIVGAESGGNPNAQATTSSALGAGQFIESTWLDVLKRNRPDLAAGKTDTELLALRRNGELSKEMVDRYADENRQRLAAAGARTDNGALYLAHFLGPGDAIKVLKAQPGQALDGIVNAASIQANAGVFKRAPTAGQLVAWAERKMGEVPGGSGGVSPQAAPWISGIRQEMVNDVSRSMGARAEGLVSVLETAIGKGRRPADGEIGDIASLLVETGRRDLIDRVDIALAKHDAAQTGLSMSVGARAAFRAQMQTLATGGDSRTRRIVDGAEEAIAAVEAGMKKTPYLTAAARGLHAAPAALDFDDPAALSAAVAQRRAFGDVIRAHDGLAPPSIFNGEAEEKAFAGRLMSNDPKQVAVAAGFASTLLAADPNAFASVTGRTDIENEAVAFRHYVDDLGMSAEQAAGKLIMNRDPEHQAKVKARVKNEDVDALIKKKLDLSDLRGAFDDSLLGWQRNPEIGFTPGQRAEMFRDYAELTKDYYLDGHGAGDMDTAKKLAQRQLKIVWGVSEVAGGRTVMRYPPERAPGVAGIESAATLIAEDAVTSIAGEGGQTVTREKIALLPIAGVTAQAFKTGQPVPYQLMWQDADGVPRILNRGRAFVVDPQALRDRQSAARGRQFQINREAAEAERLIGDDPRMPFGTR